MAEYIVGCRVISIQKPQFPFRAWILQA